MDLKKREYGNMSEIDDLVEMIKKQLFPYRHTRDIDIDSARWEVNDVEFITEWVKEMLKNCTKRMRCKNKGRCAFYEYSDQSRRNYEICRRVILLMEDGKLSLDEVDKSQ